MMLQEKASNVLDGGKAWEQGQSTGTIGDRKGGAIDLHGMYPEWCMAMNIGMFHNR